MGAFQIVTVGSFVDSNIKADSNAILSWWRQVHGIVVAVAGVRRAAMIAATRRSIVAFAIGEISLLVDTIEVSSVWMLFVVG